jgi:hypothetical protein
MWVFRDVLHFTPILHRGDESPMIATLVTLSWYDLVTRLAATVTHHPPFRAGMGCQTRPASFCNAGIHGPGNVIVGNVIEEGPARKWWGGKVGPKPAPVAVEASYTLTTLGSGPLHFGSEIAFVVLRVEMGVKVFWFHALFQFA